jgi:rRNA maturation protein Nop10
MISEHREKDICVCESRRCGNKELKHFEECPVCGSTSYHITIKRFELEEE